MGNRLAPETQGVQGVRVDRAMVNAKTKYSETSDKGHSERGQASQQRTHHLYSSIHTLYKIISERGQPLYKGQTSGSRGQPLYKGQTSGSRGQPLYKGQTSGS